MIIPQPMSFWMIIQCGLSIIEAEPLDLRYQAEPGNEWKLVLRALIQLIKLKSLSAIVLP